MENTEFTNEQRKAKRIARNKIARDIMLILIEREGFIDNILAKRAVGLANAFVDEIENNVI